MPPNEPETIIIIGPFTDAGYTTIENGHIVHHGGWEAGSLNETRAAVNVLREATQFKSPGVADSVSRLAVDVLTRELGGALANAAGSTTIVIA